MKSHFNERPNYKSGERIKELRKEMGYKQENLANELNIVRTTLSKWETGDTLPDIYNLIRLYEIFKPLNVSLDYILGLSDYRQPQNHDIGMEIGLSEKAIENLKFERFESGDNRKMNMCDFLLSDKETFSTIMGCLVSLCDPSTIVINRLNPIKPFLDPKNPDYIVLKPEHIKQLSAETPDAIYPKMKTILKKFIESINIDKLRHNNERIIE